MRIKPRSTEVFSVTKSACALGRATMLGEYSCREAGIACCKTCASSVGSAYRSFTMYMMTCSLSGIGSGSAKIGTPTLLGARPIPVALTRFGSMSEGTRWYPFINRVISMIRIASSLGTSGTLILTCPCTVLS